MVYSGEIIVFIVGVFLVSIAIWVFKLRDGRARQRRISGVLDDVLDALDKGKIIFDVSGRLCIINKAARNFFTYIEEISVAELSRQSFLDYLYDHAADFDDSIRNTILAEYAQGNEAEFREVIRSDKGGFFLVEAQSLKNDMSMFTLTDISVGQKREEDILQLHAFNHQLLQAIQATASGIVLSDPKIPGNPILFANDSFCNFSECTRSEFMQGGWAILSRLFVDEHEKDQFYDALENPKDADFSLVTLDNRQRKNFNIRLTPVYDEHEKLDLYVGVLTDISLLKQRESEFFHAQKLESLGQLAAGVAHDFNNILSIIGGYSVMTKNLVGHEPFERAQAISNLEKIETASQRGAGLTRKMLTFSKHKVIAQSVINICDIINEQRELLLPLLGVDITLDIIMPPEAVNVHGNIDSLGQILMNLVINARDAMEGGGTLTVTLSCPNVGDVPNVVSEKIGANEYVCLSVSDTGTGMDEATLEKVFDPFFSTKDQGKGTGLGLSVVYGLVQEMGGMIDVDSSLGQGTTMFVYAPRTKAIQTKTIIGDEADLSRICLDGYTVLLAEDEPDLLLLVTNMLEEIGLNVIAASNGNEALMLLDEHEGSIDILLTDVMMPELNGVDLAELVSALDPNIHIFFMSGYPASGDRAPVELPDGAAFIAKPMNYEALVAVLFRKLKEGVSGDTGGDDMPYWTTTEVKDGGVNV